MDGQDREIPKQLITLVIKEKSDDVDEISNSDEHEDALEKQAKVIT